jgi:pyruvate formate lyase activating enzyme
MKIAGLVKTSLIDYPGKIAAVIFTQGCNFRCGFCHNPDLIPITNKTLEMSESEVLDFLNSRKGRLEGVVVTGGEPTIQKDLPEFLNKIKEMGYFVKLDSNGSNPKLLKDLLKMKLLDYIAMDIKGGEEGYKDICGFTNLAAIKESIDIIMSSGVDYEFRTTVLPFYHSPSDFENIGKMVKGARLYTVQGFRPEITYEKKLSNEKRFSEKDLNEIAEILKGYVKKVSIHPNF